MSQCKGTFPVQGWPENGARPSYGPHADAVVTSIWNVLTAVSSTPG